MPDGSARDRRSFLISSAAFAGLALPFTAWAAQQKSEAPSEIEIPAVEQLMRHHGIMNRCFLVYEEGVRRLESGTAFDPGALGKAAEIVRNFMEDYHQKLEDEYLFPQFHRVGRLLDVVSVLQTQHQAGRSLTDRIRQLAGSAAKSDARRQLSQAIRSYVGMYRPHQAREDTIVFPMFRKLMRGKEYDDLGERFETLSDQKFGENAFDQAVSDISHLEQQLGLYDLAQFTPK